MDNINVAFSGDLVLQELDERKINFDDFIDIINRHNAKLCINLESPLILPEFKRFKNKITLYSYESELSILSSLSPYMVNLSNNHVNDYGEEGGKYTLELLSRNGINQFGIGYKGKKDNVKVEELFVLLSYTSRSADFSGELLFATENILGPYEVDFEQIKNIRSKYPDKAIVVNVHWGIEDITYPEYEKRILGRKIIDSGADIIIGHHSHIVQPYEIYKGSYIFYSLGNFVFGDINYNLNGKLHFKKAKAHQLKGITPIISFGRNRKVEIANIIATNFTSSGHLICKSVDLNGLKQITSGMFIYKKVNRPYVFLYDNLIPKVRIVLNKPSIIKNKINFFWNKMINKIKEIILFDLMSDTLFTKYSFYKHHGYMLDLKRVSTLNEKIQWLKLNNRRELDNTIADKLAVRNYVSSLIGDKYLIPLLKIINNIEELKSRSTYPRGDFVIKANHNSGGTHIVKGNNFDEIVLYNASKRWLTENYYRKSKEWQYKNIKPSIFIEQLLIDDNGKIPMDYKLHCFNGKVEYIVVDIDRETDHKRNIYNSNWEIQPFTWSAQDSHGSPLWGNGRDIEKPFELDEMIYVAEKLAAEYPYLRVDLYVFDNQVYFGELTLHHGSGFENIVPFEWDKKLGDLLKL